MAAADPQGLGQGGERVECRATARSPIAWKCSWKPRSASLPTASASSSGSMNCNPAWSVAWPCPSRYGSPIAAVNVSHTPSSISFTEVARK